MSQERWDAKLELLHGPLAGRGPIILQGPVIRIGAQPGPGGLSLHEYRGLDERQAVITTYGGQASIEPVGSAQVRIARHEHVNWDRVQALNGSAMLTNGCAIHLGRPGRGATLRFVDCQPLGVWEQARIQVADDAGMPQVLVDEQVVRADSGVPKWFVGGLVFVGLATLIGILLPVLQSQMRQSTVAEPALWLEDSEGQVGALTLNQLENFQGLEGMDQAWAAFVASPNAKAAGDRSFLEDRSRWDDRLLSTTAAQMLQQTLYWDFWRRLSDISEEYAGVVSALRKAGLPEALAGIPYQESKYFQPGLRNSIACAGGWWHFLPEVANRVGVEIRDCRLQGSSELYTPTAKVPPVGVYRRAEYINKDAYKKFQACMSDSSCTREQRRAITRNICRLKNGACAVDERDDFEASTEGAVRLLYDTWSQPEVKSSGAATQLTIAAHNRGWDDSRYDRNRRSPGNLRADLKRWKDSQGGSDSTAYRFIGDQMQCEANDQFREGACSGLLPPETQHYVYRVLAQHFLAVCFYAKNFSESSVFGAWSQFEDGYCSQIKIPSLDEVRDATRRKNQ